MPTHGAGIMSGFGKRRLVSHFWAQGDGGVLFCKETGREREKMVKRRRGRRRKFYERASTEKPEAQSIQ